MFGAPYPTHALGNEATSHVLRNNADVPCMLIGSVKPHDTFLKNMPVKMEQWSSRCHFRHGSLLLRCG